MNELAGTGVLIRLALRRDRIRLWLWAGTMASYPPLLQAPATKALYPHPSDLRHYLEDVSGNATFRMLYGSVPSATVGGLTAWRCSFLLVVVGLATALTVIRHTRADEESGRAELVCATSVGRRAPLAAALAVAIGTSVAIGASIAVGMGALGESVSGSLAYGATVAAAGMMFAGVGAVAAQLTQGSGAARAMAVSTLGAAFLFRAVADADADRSLSWLAWASPIGWLHEVSPYGRDLWWALVLPVLLTAMLLVVAVRLSARRDFAAGLLPPRPGPASAAPSFRSPLALAWRQHRGSVVGWTVGLALVGGVFGGVATGADDLLEHSPELRDIFERIGGSSTLTDAFLAGVFGIVGIMAAAQAVQGALRLRSEEESGRAEPILAAPVRRARWVASHLVLVAVGPAASVLAAGVVGGLAFGLGDGHLGSDLPRVLASAAVQLPAVWVLAGLAVLLFGALPRWCAAAWTAVGWCFLVGQVGAILKLDQHILDLSPFTHVPPRPGHDLRPSALGVLLGVAVALVAAGVAAFDHRDASAG